MNLHYYFLMPGMAALFFCLPAHGVANTQLSLDISAESEPRVAIYYIDKPISGGQIDLTLTINSSSRKLEDTSGTFYVVGNVKSADVIFFEEQFILNSNNGGANSIKLDGKFIFNGFEHSTQQTLQIPVIKNISDQNSTNGFKVKFSSERSVDNYSSGDYSSIFTLIVKPVI